MRQGGIVWGRGLRRLTGSPRNAGVTNRCSRQDTTPSFAAALLSYAPLLRRRARCPSGPLPPVHSGASTALDGCVSTVCIAPEPFVLSSCTARGCPRSSRALRLSSTALMCSPAWRAFSTASRTSSASACKRSVVCETVRSHCSRSACACLTLRSRRLRVAANVGQAS